MSKLAARVGISVVCFGCETVYRYESETWVKGRACKHCECCIYRCVDCHQRGVLSCCMRSYLNKPGRPKLGHLARTEMLTLRLLPLEMDELRIAFEREKKSTSDYTETFSDWVRRKLIDERSV